MFSVLKFNKGFFKGKISLLSSLITFFSVLISGFFFGIIKFSLNALDDKIMKQNIVIRIDIFLYLIIILVNESIIYVISSYV